jgi:hypothetical protein
MPLIKEIDNALPFVADLPIAWQRDIARFISTLVTSYDNERTMTHEQRLRLSELEQEEMERRLRDLE